MAEPVYISVVIIISILTVYFLRFKCLYLLFIDAFIQNTILPFLYTSFGASRGLIASLLVSKEIVLVVLAAWCIYLWESRIRRPWPKPVVILFIFTCYCIVRIAFALATGDNVSDSFRKLRLVCLPLLFLIVAITAAYSEPAFARRFLKQMVYLLVVLAFVGILMWILPPSDFWVNHANVAAYGLEVKGAEAYEYDADTGISHSAAGRETFLSLAPFRAFGTFGDPLAMGFALTSPFLLFAFIYERSVWTFFYLLILVLGMFVTFDRSAWIFLFVGSIVVLFRRRKYKLLLVIAIVPIVALLTVPPLAEFAKFETEDLSWSHPQGEGHAESIVLLYKKGFTDIGNVLGKGMRDDVRVITESGYGFLLEHFGMPAYFLWLWFLIAMYRHLKNRDALLRRIPQVSQGMIMGTFVVMHFSHYPFSFIGWIPIWYLFGLSLACPQASERRLQKSLPYPGHGAALDQGT